MGYGKHLGFIYNTQDEHQSFVSNYVIDGVNDHHKILYITDTHTPEVFYDYLRDCDLDPRGLVDSGQLKILTAQDVYLKEGKYTPETVLRVLKKEVKKTRLEGYTLLRYCVEVTGVLQKLFGTEEYAEFLVGLHECLETEIAMVLFLYDRAKVDQAAVFHILTAHPRLCIQEEILDNSFFIEPSALSDHQHVEDSLDAFLSSLKESKQNKITLQKRDALFTLFLEVVDSPVALLNDTGQILRLNPKAQQIMEYTLEEVKGKRFCDLFLDLELQRVCIQMMEAQTGRDLQKRRFSWSAPSKVLKEVEWQARSFRPDHDTRDFILWIGKDYTPFIQLKKDQESELANIQRQHRLTIEQLEKEHQQACEKAHLDYQQKIAQLQKDAGENEKTLHDVCNKVREEALGQVNAYEDKIRILHTQLEEQQAESEAYLAKINQKVSEHQAHHRLAHRILDHTGQLCCYLPCDGSERLSNAPFERFLEEMGEREEPFFSRWFSVDEQGRWVLRSDDEMVLEWNQRCVDWKVYSLDEEGWILEGTDITDQKNQFQAKASEIDALKEEQSLFVLLNRLKGAKDWDEVLQRLAFIIQSKKVELFHRQSLEGDETLIAQWSTGEGPHGIDLFEMRQQHVCEEGDFTEIRGFYAIPPGSIPEPIKETIRKWLPLIHDRVKQMKMHEAYQEMKGTYIPSLLRKNELLTAQIQFIGHALGLHPRSVKSGAPELIGSVIVEPILLKHKQISDLAQELCMLQDKKDQNEVIVKHQAPVSTPSPVLWREDRNFFQEIVDQILRELPIDGIRVWWINDQKIYEVVGKAGLPIPYERPCKLDFQDPLMGKVFQGLVPWSLVDLSSSLVFSSKIKDYHHYGFQVFGGFPIKDGETVVGWIEVVNLRSWEETDWLAHHIQQIAQSIGIQYESFMRIRQKSKILLTHQLWLQEGLGAVIRTMEEKRIESPGHQDRIAAMVRQMAPSLRYPHQSLDILLQSVMLHDLGMLAIDDATVLQASPLSSVQRKAIQKHVELGTQLLRGLRHIPGLLDVPAYHHERWDGSGYPHGLKGEEIPMSARLFAVVDVFDALSSNRSYRSAWPKQSIRQYILDNRGILFDPDVVDIFIQNEFDHKGDELR